MFDNFKLIFSSFFTLFANLLCANCRHKNSPYSKNNSNYIHINSYMLYIL